jgi:sugar phosphate isomerase/epimerase
MDEELFKLYRDAGIFYMEVSLGKKETEELDFDKLNEWSKKYGITLWSFHLPFWPFNEIDISRPDIADKSVEYLTQFIEKGGKIGIDKFVIHASGEPIEESQRNERMEIAKKSLFKLAEVAKKYGAVIAVEDLPRSCLGRDIDDMIELVSAHEDLKVCFDVNHLLKGDSLSDFVRKLADKIITTHISDFDFVNERHWLPGEGQIDWQELLSVFKEVGYDGMWLYEINLKCPKTIIRDRDFTFEDFVVNANELFDGKTPTTFYKPKENLGYWE